MERVLDVSFTLNDQLTDEQLSFFNEYGVIVFKNFINKDKVNACLAELARIEKQWIEEGKDKINGVPLKFGKDENGNSTIQRFCFLSLHSKCLGN